MIIFFNDIKFELIDENKFLMVWFVIIFFIFRGVIKRKHFDFLLLNYLHFTKGSYFIARPSINQSTIVSKLSMQWSKRKSYCMQFWYVVPARSDSSIKVCFEEYNSTICLWSMPSSITNEWTFGQVEIPGHLDGKVSNS